jgi:hypothetical protein
VGYGTLIQQVFEANPHLVIRRKDGSRAMTLNDGLTRVTISLQTKQPKHASGSPICGARRKRDGLPCTLPALTGFTRCRYHGCGGRSADYRGGPKTLAGIERIREGVRRREERRRQRIANGAAASGALTLVRG